MTDSEDKARAALVRAKAWATRRAKYGGSGHSRLAYMSRQVEDLLRERDNLRYEIVQLKAEIATWGQIWNNDVLLATRVEALRDGTADTA